MNKAASRLAWAPQGAGEILAKRRRPKWSGVLEELLKYYSAIFLVVYTITQNGSDVAFFRKQGVTVTKDPIPPTGP
jgi:hypothetical protein